MAEWKFMGGDQDSQISDICVVLLKWDALELGKKREIDIIGTTTEWFRSKGLRVLAVHYIRNLTGDQIDRIYQGNRNQPYYPSLKNTLTGTHAVAMIIGGNGDVADQVKIIKGDPDTEGSIRWHWSYKRQFENSPEFNDWLNKRGKFADPVQWQDIQYKIYRDDRIHSSITPEETRNNCRALFPRSMLQSIIKTYPNLIGQIYD